MSTLAKKSSWHGPKQVGLMIYLGVLMLFASCVCGGSTNTVLPFISEKYGWDINFLRSFAGMGVMAGVVGNFVFGTVTKYKGPKLANAIGLIAFAICMVIYGFTKNLAVFLGMVLVLGFFSGSFNGAANLALTANWWPTKKGAVLGFTTIGIVLMDLVWAPMAPKWFAVIGVDKTYLIFAAIVLVVAVLGILFTHNTPEEAGEYPDGDAENAEDLAAVAKAMKEYKSPFTLAKLCKTPAIWAIFFGLGLMRMVNLSFAASIVPRLLSCGYDYHLSVVVLMVGGVAGIIGSAAIGLLDQKFGTKKAIFIYAILFIIAMVIACFHAQSIVAVWVSSIIILAVCGGTANLIPSAAICKFGRWDYPSASRIIQVGSELGAGVGIMLTGVFHNFQNMYYFGIVCLVIGLIIIGRMKFNLIGKAG